MWVEGAYTRIQLKRVDGVFNMLLLFWDAGATSPVHSHGQSDCFIKVVSGHLRERVFVTPTTQGQVLSSAREAAFYLPGTVSKMSNAVGLHDITSSGRSVSLHVYVPGYTHCYAMPPHA
jgi:predicted metal-dependent enzyme (double-stranded beta helix superfamily)